MKNNEAKKIYSVKEFAQMFDLGKNAAYAAIHRKEIPVIKIGGKLMISKAVLDRLLEAK